MQRPWLILFAGLLTTASCAGAPEERSTPDDSDPVMVSTGLVEVTDWIDTVEVGGVFRSRATAVVASRIMAPVVAVHVRAGDRVSRGQLLIDLDAAQQRAQASGGARSLEAAEQAAQAAAASVAGAEAALELAHQTHERIRSLHERRSATAQELDEATAALTAAESHLAAARAQAGSATAAVEASRSAAEAGEIAPAYGSLVAPFDALVAERRVDPGTMATPGTPLLVLEELGSLRLEVQLDATRAADVRAGMPVDVRSDGAGPVWVEGRVSEIARVDSASHSFDVKIDLPASSTWRSGLFGRARFVIASRTALTMPAAAVVRQGQLTMAFVVDADNRVGLRAIRVGESSADRVEVLAGLSGGDVVVLTPPPGLEDGRLVAATPGGAGR